MNVQLPKTDIGTRETEPRMRCAVHPVVLLPRLTDLIANSLSLPMPWPAIGLAISLATLLVVMPVHAMDFSYDGYVDLRLVTTDGERSYLDGGLGKLRYDDGDPVPEFGGAVLQGTALLTPEIAAVAVVRADSQQRNFVLPLETYARYRPVSTTAWRGSLKIGAFFPPFSLENTELGWTSYWTITPSAINSWIGDELRTIGGEGTLEWRSSESTLRIIAALYGWNDPAGVLMAERGWAMDDEPTALFEHPRRPDATLILFGAPHPDTTPLFYEIDHRVGWYAGAAWSDTDSWRLEVYRYDNRADPAAHISDYFAWHTDFWDGGLSRTWEEFTLLAQGLAGETIIAPSPGYTSTTRFSSAYALAGWERGDWRLAIRGEVFRTHDAPGSPLSEDGSAVTASTSWTPKDWLRLSAEILHIDSARNEQRIIGLSPHRAETQTQLCARLFL
jgi:hypothetical protein